MEFVKYTIKNGTPDRRQVKWTDLTQEALAVEDTRILKKRQY